MGETIVAPATPSGQSAIGLIRASGPLCLEVCGGALGVSQPEARRATLANYSDVGGQVIDQVLFTYFIPEGSYTGEELLEVACHGNPLIMQRITEDMLARGCRPAEAGEFTRTAFMNGKMDLSQAEAVCDVISARSERALEVARRQLCGALGERVNAYTERLLQVMAELEAYIDFPEEDLPEDSGPVGELGALIGEFRELEETSHYKEVLHEGVKVVIMGAPNAGKSSLLNVLTGEERAIVSAEPGTTRDVITDRIMMGPYCIQIMDTAGLHDPTSDIEAIGIGKAMEKIREADYHLLVVDQSVPHPTLSEELLGYLRVENTMVVVNKVDLPVDGGNGVDGGFLEGYERCRVSMKTQEGVTGFREALVGAFERNLEPGGGDDLVVSSRHAVALGKARGSLEVALVRIRGGEPAELAASEMRLALEALGEIIGRVDNELVLDKLFSTFCIGK